MTEKTLIRTLSPGDSLKKVEDLAGGKFFIEVDTNSEPGIPSQFEGQITTGLNQDYLLARQGTKFPLNLNRYLAKQVPGINEIRLYGEQ